MNGPQAAPARTASPVAHLGALFVAAMAAATAGCGGGTQQVSWNNAGTGSALGPVRGARRATPRPVGAAFWAGFRADWREGSGRVGVGTPTQAWSARVVARSTNV